MSDEDRRPQPKPASAPKRRRPWLAIPIILGALSTLTVGYFSTLTPARIVDGPRVIDINTHQTTVAAALREAGVVLDPADQVNPPRDAALSRGDAITIKRATPARVLIDALEPRTIRTQASTGREALKQMGVAVGTFDLVTVNGGYDDIIPANSAATVEIRYRPALDIAIVDQGTPQTVKTAALTVGEALMQAGRTPFLADRITPPVGTTLQPGMTIDVVRAKPVTVIVDGRRLRTRTHAATIGDVLTELNIVLYDQDFARPALETAITDNLEIRVVRVKRELVVTQDIIPFDTRHQPDANLELDNTIIGQAGAPGIREKRTMVTLEDGAEVQRELVADFVAREAQPRIYKYGTRVVIRTLDTPDGPVQYWRAIKMWATSYSASTAGVPRTARNYGITRCGIPMRSGIVAIDPTVVPLRSYVYVPGYGTGYACDTGGAIQNKRIDLGYDDDNLKLWRGWVTVYLLAPAPAKIQYVLDPDE
ncbi:MAG: ubiquitin-like domain-containing protein [Thermoflexales bacterium]|nr:ubiquitin-like domain-containing protein [Thermoflexales bacterium]